MRILIDGDEFPNIKDIILLAKSYQKEVIIYIDTSHFLESNYATVVIVDKGANAVDLVIQNEVREDDLVLTQDYGVASIALFKGAYSLNQLGYFYTKENIDYLMEIKTMKQKLRKHSKVKGPKKRTKNDEKRLLCCIEELMIRSGSND